MADVPIRALCFDLDGTLVRFQGDFLAWLGHLMDDAGVPWAARERVKGELLRRLPRAEAQDAADVLRAALAAQRLEPPADLGARCREAVARYLAEVAPIEGAPALLDALAARGLPLAVVSNGPADMQRGAAATLGLERFRAVVVSGDPAVARRKPDPEVFARALEALGTPAEATPMVGDSPADALGAHRAGMPVLLLGEQPMPEGVAEPQRFADLTELAGWLERRLGWD